MFYLNQFDLVDAMNKIFDQMKEKKNRLKAAA